MSQQRSTEALSATRVAALFDIHGNLPALEAVLDDVRRAQADAVVIGGDVFPGPMPIETLHLLASLDRRVYFIKGNGDRVVLEARAGHPIAEVPEAHRNTIHSAAEALTDREAQAIDAWPATLEMRIGALGHVLFCHATPRNDRDIFTRATPEADLLALFEPPGVPLVVCGHTHMPFDRMVGGTRVVNAGSVGMPFGQPGAYWLLLGPGVELRRTAYDLDAAAQRIRATAYPQAEEFAARSVLQPPSEEQMLAAYSRVDVASRRPGEPVAGPVQPFKNNSVKL